MKKLFLLALMGLMTASVSAQRFTDKLDRGLVAIPQGDKTGQDKNYGTSGSGIFVSWRVLPAEYFDTKYNLYRNGTKIASDLTKSNYQDNAGTAASQYQVEAVINGVAQPKSAAVTPWAHQYLEIPMQPVKNRSNKDVTSGYSLNDCSVADVDGDGQMEIVVKRRNDSGNLTSSSNKTDFNLHECYKMDGTRLWWIDMGPNLMSGPDEQFDLILCDWDRDGKAEAVMRGADNMIIHTKSGKAIKIGNMNYYAPRDEYTHEGAEYLLYLNGETGEPYGWDGVSDTFTPMAYPLPRFESGETNYATVWGKADTGHRSAKHFFGAPYLDGRNPSIFLGRGCYTRHKFCALDVDPATHQLTQRWRWNCYDSKSPWFGNGFHNFAIADVDMDGRDEIVFGSMMIDDTGYGLATTGYGHGDSQHCTDLDPYRWGLEQFVCLESTAVPGVAYTNAMSQQLLYASGTGGDNGRAMAGNFQNTYPGGVARSPGSGLLSCVSDKIIEGATQMSSDDYWNMRIFWDGDLLSEFMDSPGVEREACVYKYGGQSEVGTGRSAYPNSRVFLSAGCALNNSSKNNPGFLGDILGDWREELVVRTGDNKALRIYTTSYESPWGLTSLWYDHVYRNGMTWQCVSYNQPPQVSFFVGELEGITNCPPALTLEGRTEVTGTIQTTTDHLLISGYENKTVAVAEGASPYILTVNAPAWVKGSGAQQATASTPKQPARTVELFTTTLTGGAFGGTTRLVKQGEGVLVLPNVVEKYTGATDVWNGTLQFDGTMQSSPVWLNRHTTLVSNGGQFLAGIKADYNATIYPGGKDHVGTMKSSTLTLGFGSRIVFDVTAEADVMDVATLTIETKDWGEYSPKYKSPVFQFNSASTPAAGKYKLMTVGTVTGRLEDIVLEGISGKGTSLSLEDGVVYLNVNDMRAAADIVWNGMADSGIWDFGVTKNFLKNGVADIAGLNDNVTFNDDAANTNVVVKGQVKPATVTFSNETKNYTLSGDSILGGAAFVKTGAGKVTVNTENRFSSVQINGGIVEVNRLANKTGQTYGSLGDATKTINMADGATLVTNGTIITDQPLSVSGKVTVSVPSGKNVIFSNSVRGAGATIVKTGAGYWQMGLTTSFQKLVLQQGTVESQKNNSVMQVPDTIELRGGTYYDFPNEASGFTNKAQLVSVKGTTSTFYGAPNCNYTGTLTGEGTVNFYGCGNATNYQGDWSQFEGTIKVGMQDRTVKGASSLGFYFRNAKGLPKATVDLSAKSGNNPVTFTTSNLIEIGAVTGSGTLAGTGFILGTSGKNIVAQFSSTAPITKRGTGEMTVSKAGNLSGTLTVEEGSVSFTDDARESQFFGNVTVKGSGTLHGYGLLPNLTLENGGKAMLSDNLLGWPGTMQVVTTCNAKVGSIVDVIIDGVASNSLLQAKFLTLNGTVKVELEGYTPKKGDAFTIWKGTNSISGTPTLELPALPEGLNWDTSELVAADGKALKTGVLKVTDTALTAVSGIGTDNPVSCEVYTLGGMFVTSFKAPVGQLRTMVSSLPLQPGTYLLQPQGRPAFKVVVK